MNTTGDMPKPTTMNTVDLERALWAVLISMRTSQVIGAADVVIDLVRTTLEHRPDACSDRQLLACSVIFHPTIVRLVQLLLSHGISPSGVPLLRAIAEGNELLVGYLIGAGADVRGTLAHAKFTPHIMPLLVAGGADIDEANDDGETLLFDAVARNAPPNAIQSLIDLGADPHRARPDGQTPMDIASDDHKAIMRRGPQGPAEE